MQKPLFHTWSSSERLDLAKARAGKLVDHIAPLFLMHEANAAIIYSTQLSAQIPRSYAAHAFNQFQHSMHLFEIIRLCAIWDKPATDRESIPTIIVLFNEPQLIDQLVNDARDFHAMQAPPDSIRQDDNDHKSWWKKDRKEFADLVEDTIRDKLSFAVEKVTEIRNSSRLKALMDFRDRYIAHNLDIPQSTLSGTANVENLKYNDETTILEDTIAVADALHHGLNQTGFDWNGSREIARKNANALWSNCTFDIQTRQSL